MTDDLVKRFRERNVMDYADFDAVVDRIEKLEAALRAIIVHCEVPAPPNAEELIMFAQKELEGKDE